MVDGGWWMCCMTEAVDGERVKEGREEEKAVINIVRCPRMCVLGELVLPYMRRYLVRKRRPYVSGRGQ